MHTLEIDAYVVDVLMPDLVGHDRHPTAFFVWLYLWRQGAVDGSLRVSRSLRQIAEGTGASRRAIQSALARLESRRLLAIERASNTAVPSYTLRHPWREVVTRQPRRT
jgi:hypothetical protein